MKKRDQKIEEIVQGVLDYFKTSKQEELLPLVLEELESVAERMSEEKTAYVVSAVPLTKKDKERVSSLLESLLGGKIKIRNIVDKNVLGGFKIKIGDFYLDATLKSQLTFLKRKLWQV